MVKQPERDSRVRRQGRSSCQGRSGSWYCIDSDPTAGDASVMFNYDTDGCGDGRERSGHSECHYPDHDRIQHSTLTNQLDLDTQTRAKRKATEYLQTSTFSLRSSSTCLHFFPYSNLQPRTNFSTVVPENSLLENHHYWHC